jgi:hypothetical protein
MLEKLKKKLAENQQTLKKVFFAEDTVIDSRMETCRQCENFNSNFSTCKICRCFMPAKTKLLIATCPVKKW